MCRGSVARVDVKLRRYHGALSSRTVPCVVAMEAEGETLAQVPMYVSVIDRAYSIL